MHTLLPFERNCLEIGCDEAGRGSLISCVTAAAVYFDPALEIPPALNDSKKVTVRNRAKLYEWIKANCRYGFGLATEKEIDATNIQQATFLAMHRAIGEVGVRPEHLLIDGDRFAPYSHESVVVPYKCVKQGDGKYASIAAASIVAKFCRDKLITDLATDDPSLNEKYGISKNFGYGSKQHMEGVAKYGPSKHHRMSFAPCKFWTAPE